MDKRALDALARRLGARHSRRHVLRAAGFGTAGALGATLLPSRSGRGRAQGTATVDIVDNAFEPVSVTVDAGGTVTWTNIGERPHTVTADDGAFDSGRLAPKATFSHTFDSPGTVPYHCEFHGGMVADVVVGEATPVATEPYVRRDVHNLIADGPELTAYAEAVRVMRTWDLDADLLNFQRSWRYQGNMHDLWIGPPEPPEPSPRPLGWVTCEHSFMQLNRFFWPWHRMYLYWFEQIVREASGDPTFALPYWDYSDPAQPDKRILPAPFRDENNPLYVADRRQSVNSDQIPTEPDSTFDFCIGLGAAGFDAAYQGIEFGPHGGVHNYINGWMADPARAARDPIFWLHHANIDRLWESWNVLGGANPGDDAWLDRDTNLDSGDRYEFFDSAGNQVTTNRTARDGGRTADLGYEYETLAVLSGCPEFLRTPPGPVESGAGTPAATPGAMLEMGNSAPEGGIAVGPDQAAVLVTLDQPEAASNADSVILTVGGIRSEGVPAVVVEVYINLPPGQEPDYRTPYYVGNLYLFGLTPAIGATETSHAEHNADGRTQEFNIARNVQALTASGEWAGEANVTLVPYYTAGDGQTEAAGATPAAGGSPEAGTSPPGPWITVESISVSAS